MRKLMWFTVGFAVAAVIGMYFLWESWYFLAAGICGFLLAISLLLMMRNRRLRIAAMVCFGALLGFLWMFAFDSFYLTVPRFADGTSLEMTVSVTDYSEPGQYDKVAEGVGFLNHKPYRMRLYLPNDMVVAPGDSLTAIFRLRSTLPGGVADASYRRSDGIFLTAIADTAVSVYPAEQMPWFGYPALVRNSIIHKIDAIFPSDTAAFAKALLLGDTDDIDYETDTALKNSGIRHVIAVSGLHVTILFSLVYFLTGKKRLLTTLVALPVLLFFAAVAGFSPSITRACIMHSLMVVALLFDKEYDAPTALAFAVLSMLIVNPWTVTNVGFHLSVGCMVGILCFCEPIKNWLLDTARLGRFHGKAKKAAAWVASSVAMSLSAVIFTTPLCAIYFGSVSLVSPLTNLLTLWAVSIAFYGVIACCAAGFLWTGLGAAMGWVISWTIRYVLIVAKGMAAFPLSAVYTASIYIVLWLIFCYALLLIYLLMKNKQPFVFGCIATICLCIALIASWTEGNRDDCRVTVLDVGQGQSILLQSDGKNYLVDCGGDSDTLAADKAAAQLLSQGIYRLNGLILTHFDYDHAAGAGYLLSRVPADAIYFPSCPDTDGYGQALLDKYSNQSVPIIQQTQLHYGANKLTMLPSINQLSDNESGLCVLFQTENCDILITGDRSAAGERELMEQIALPKLEVLIVGHHGSKYSSDVALLQATTPEYALISVGTDNHYGHPTEEVLQRLTDCGSTILRTDLQGTIIFRR